MTGAVIPRLTAYVIPGLTRNLHHRPVFNHEQRIRLIPFPIQQEQQLLAFSSRSHDMHFPHMPQPLARHRHIRHRGQFQQDEPARFEQFGQQSHHIRPAILDEEHLPTVLRPPRRIQIDDIRVKPVQYLLHLSRNNLPVPKPHISNAQLLEIQLRCPCQFRLHLIIQHLPRRLRKRPTIDSHSARQVG